MHEDSITRITCDELNVRVYTAVTLNLVNEIASIHRLSSAATLLLARAVNTTTLLGATLKPGSLQSISFKISCTGPAREVHAQADAMGNVRAYVSNPEPEKELGAGDDPAGRLIGTGFLSITKDLGMREPYTSVMPLRNSDIAYNCAYYLAHSEQIPSAILLGTFMNAEGTLLASGGILVQTYPGTSRDSILEIEKNITSLAPPLGERLWKGEDIKAVASHLMGYRLMKVLSTSGLRAACRCNREMLEKVLEGLDRAELEDMIAKDHGTEMHCTFCGRLYQFGEDDIRTVLARKG